MSVKAIWSTAKATGNKFSKGSLSARKALASEGRSASKQIPNSVDTSKTMMGRGLSTMRKRKVRTGLIVGAGMGVAAGIRNTGPGTSSGSSSFYRY